MGEKEEMIKETEPFYFKVADDKIASHYRGVDYTIDIENNKE
jgi:hypothetical protein